MQSLPNYQFPIERNQNLRPHDSPSNILAKGLLMPPPYFTTTFLRSQQKYKYYQNKERLFGKK